ncbi:MAG: hypothetical protein QOD67_1020, partial [Caballeronia sp.]|nr:hypothetical protein [Caballeronia sp.]
MPVAALEEAAHLLRGEFLGGLDLPTCYRFHNWCVGQRERYGRMRETVLHSLIRGLAGEPLAALQYGRELVETDPLSEPAHATLVRLLEAAGRCAEAENHYAYARDLVRRELGTSACAMLDEAIRHLRQRARALPRNTDSISAVRDAGSVTFAAHEGVSGNYSMAGTIEAAVTNENRRELASHAEGIFQPPFVGRGPERMMLDGLLLSASVDNRDLADRRTGHRENAPAGILQRAGAMRGASCASRPLLRSRDDPAVRHL